MTLVITRKEVNNEIILLRQFVRQARICTINKLVREAKKLRTNRGNEKQLQKNKNKSDKLLREVVALKRIKDDEISKFGIISLENLQDVIQNPSSDDRTRAMAKVARYKSFNTRIMEFTKKFPNCKEYISWRQKDHLQNKKRRNPVNDLSQGTPKRLLNENVSKNIEFMKNMKDIDNIRDPFIDPSECVTKQEHMKINLYEQEKCQSNKQQSKESRKKSTNVWEICNIGDVQESKSVVNVISKEATVKRFTDILQETSTEDINSSFTENSGKQLLKESMETEGKIDDFFLNSDKVMPSLNTAISVQERQVNKTRFVDNNTFKVLRRENGAGKFYSNKISIERKNKKRQKLDGKGVSRDQSSIKVSNTEHLKQDKQIARTEGKPVQGNAKILSAVENEKLHPSWVARKKQQEIMKQGFQGKKIRFDEN